MPAKNIDFRRGLSRDLISKFKLTQPKELESKLERQEDMAPLTDAEIESVSGGVNPFADAPRVNVKEIDDRLRETVGNP